MQPASVGFQCPDCAGAGRQQVIRGRQLGAGSLLVTNALIAANVAVFVAGLGDGLRTRGSVIFDGGLAGPFVADGEWWRIVSSGFLHANLIHIAFNCLVLYQLGQLLEPVLGRARFAAAYLCSMIAGSLGVLVVDPGALTVGASGAVFGMMGVAVAVMRSRGINPFQTGLGGTIMLNLLLTFSIRGISIGGHVGGLVGGLVAGWVITELSQRSRGVAVPVGAVGALTGALALGCIAIA
jgi:membrane associated rhomboid family serine protease